MSMKLSKEGDKWVLSILRRRGKGKIVAVVSKILDDARAETLVPAAEEMTASLRTRIDVGGL